MSEADAQLPDRRKGGRRRADREGDSHPPGRGGSWFGSLGDSTPPAAAVALADDEGDAAAAGQEDRRAFPGLERSDAEQGAAAFARIYQTFIAARAWLGIALLLVPLAAQVFGVRPPTLLLMLCSVYAVETIATWVLPRLSGAEDGGPSRLSRRQWILTIGFDLVVFSLLQLLAPGTGLNFIALLVLPVLMAGVLTPRRQALATAAAVAMVLLGSAWFGVVGGGEPTLLLSQAGLVASGLFAITLLAGELAARLAREERSARGSLEMARQQAQLNRLVIEEMQDGVLVVDRKGRVRAANPAARSLLSAGGLADPAPFQLRGVEAWAPLVTAMEQAFVESSWPEAGRDLTLRFSPGAARTLRMRVRFTRRREPQATEEFCVLFLDDLRSVQARTRQEKLAAMGRVSAGIAHEIRNPLAAIAQANALLSEDAETDPQRRLTQMIGANVERLKRIVDDVMEVAPGAPPMQAVIEVGALVRGACDEWLRTVGLRAGSDGPLGIEAPREEIGVVFDAEHLRRVLVNLLDNARRHGGEAPGAIAVRLESRDDRHAVLSVISGGDDIPPEIEPFLFEPFFSTRSRGTGLGLYICRELCERYGASIDYRQRPADEALRNQFVVVMRREALPPASAAVTRSLFSA